MLKTEAFRINQFVQPSLNLDSIAAAIKSTDFFTQDYDEIKVSDTAKPESKVGLVLVRISAVGISFIDFL